MKIKTIDINGREWFDKVNGNSYFSATIDINYKLKTWASFKLPYQYGYGTHYKDMAFKKICEELSIKTGLSLWRYCEENNIILRADIKTGCLKRDVINGGV